jgi:hypothetical protein
VPLPREIAAALEGVDAEAGQARVAAAAALTTADVVEVSGQVDAQVVWAWLAERGEGFAVNARNLTEMADAGVPADVIDVVVALSYPRVFAINPATQQGQMRPEVAEGGAAPSAYGYAPSAWGSRFSPYGWDSYWTYNSGYYSPFGYGSYGYYGPFGGYGYGSYGYPYGNGSYGDGVIITVVGGGQIQPASHGRVVNGRGYTQSTGTGREATAHPQPDRNTGSTSSSGASQSSGGTASPRSGSASPSSSSSSSGSSSSTGRTAQPRPPR